MFLASIVLLFVLLLTFYFYWKWRHSMAPNNIPGPPPEFLIGNLRNSGILSGRKTMHEAFAELKRIYGDVFTFWFGPYRCLVFNRVEHAQHIFTSRHIYETSDVVVANFSLLIPDSMFVTRGERWKRHARVVLPMLKRAKIAQYVDTIVVCTDRFIETQLVKDDGGKKDLIAKCQAFLLSIIVSIAFDSDSKKLDAEQQTLSQALKEYVRFTAQFLMLTGIPKWLGRVYLFLNWRYRNARQVIRQHCMNIVTEEQKRRHGESALVSKRRNIIAFFVASLNDEANDNDTSSGLNLPELLDEIQGIINGGFDTTSTALSWFIHFASKHPHVQQSIKDELRRHDLFPLNDNVVLTSDILNALSYVDCVVKEVFRCAPIAVLVSRTALCDDLIDGTIHVRKGDTIFISTYNMHFDPRYWQIDPTLFAPERFLDEDKDHHRYAFAPFGGGHRVCAGQELAWLELKTIIVRLMQRVTLVDTGLPDNSGGFDQQLVCYPKHLAVNVRVDNEL